MFAVQADGAEIMTVEGLEKTASFIPSKSVWRCLWIAMRLLHARAHAFYGPSLLSKNKTAERKRNA